MKEQQKKKSIGILNQGKNNTFIRNTFSGLNVGIQDEGGGTFASGNEFDNGEHVKKNWFSMDNPVTAVVVKILGAILLAAVVSFAYKFRLPLVFGSN